MLYVAKKCCATKLIYRYAPPVEPGLRARWWSVDVDRPHLDPLQWDGPADPGVGFPLPTADAPDFEVINNSASVTDSGSGAGAARYGVIDGWIYIPEDGLIRDGNQNTGELGMVLMSACCSGTLTERPGGNHAASTETVDRTLLDPQPITAGWHYIYNPQSDLSAFQGLQLQTSVDDGATWVNVAQRQPEVPVVEVDEIQTCQPIPAGWQVEPLSGCCPPSYSPSAPAVVASNAIPIADNEVDTAIRTGQVGTSLDYARADHNHPIRRQANPGDITLVAGGNAVITQPTIILDRWSTEETYEFNTRTRVSQVAGTGWGWLSVPTIAGFQQPQIVGLGSYRSDSTVPQDDNGTFGAAPRGPLMAREVHHWSSTNRLYLAYFRRDNDITSLFIEAVIRYIRN